MPGQGLGLFSEAGDPTLGLTAPIGDSGARRGVMDNSDDRVRRCRCAAIDASFGICAPATQALHPAYNYVGLVLCSFNISETTHLCRNPVQQGCTIEGSIEELSVSLIENMNRNP